MDIREVLRRLQAGQSDRAIARDTGMHRKTVARYRAWAEEQGLLDAPLPALGELHRLLEETLPTTPPPQNTSTVEPYREVVEKLRQQGVEIAAIHQRLKERGYKGSYSALYCFVRALEPRPAEATVRVETPPGQEAQVDFGYAGQMLDPESGQLRKTWTFVTPALHPQRGASVTLSWSRHQYVEFVFEQSVETWLRCHRHALAFFGGVPERVVPDNLKAAIVRACWEEPEAQQATVSAPSIMASSSPPAVPASPSTRARWNRAASTTSNATF